MSKKIKKIAAHVLTIELAPTLVGHWYLIDGKNLYPSSTTILNFYPQSTQLTQWIAEKGWHESQEIKTEAGKRGTNVHEAIEHLLKGGELSQEFYNLEEWHKISTFISWYKEYEPKIIETETTVVSKKYKFAGKFDCLAKIDGRMYVLDWKTSKSAYPHFALQVASYAFALGEMRKINIEGTACVLLGARNKDGFRFLEYPDWNDNFKKFLAVKTIFENEVKEPPQIINLPTKLKL